MSPRVMSNVTRVYVRWIIMTVHEHHMYIYILYIYIYIYIHHYNYIYIFIRPIVHILYIRVVF